MILFLDYLNTHHWHYFNHFKNKRRNFNISLTKLKRTHTHTRAINYEIYFQLLCNAIKRILRTSLYNSYNSKMQREDIYNYYCYLSLFLTLEIMKF